MKFKKVEEKILEKGFILEGYQSNGYLPLFHYDHPKSQFEKYNNFIKKLKLEGKYG